MLVVFMYTNSMAGYQKQEGRHELEKVCLCIAGFLQPLPFIQRLYPGLTECNDGFVDWFLLCSPRPMMPLDEEVEEWCDKLKQYALKSMEKPYSITSRWHHDIQSVYTFSPSAKEQYRLFSNKITRKMNSLLAFENEGDISGNFSKDKWTVIRYL